jgi:hypothetical protein
MHGMTSQPHPASTDVRIDISPGELIDKITILEIKKSRITDADKLRNVSHELGLLQNTCDSALETTPELSRLATDLRDVNLQLWEIEDDLRECERNQQFDERFIELARAVYHTNDRRAALKAEINTLLGSTLVEEKSYAAY